MVDVALQVEGGQAPRRDDREQPRDVDPGSVTFAPPPPGIADQLEQFEVASVKVLLGALFFLPLRLLFGRQGPPDAFRPDEATKGDIAEPLTRILNRSALVRFARLSDAVAVVGATGAYVGSEFDRVRAYQAAVAAGSPTYDAAHAAARFDSGLDREQPPPVFANAADFDFEAPEPPPVGRPPSRQPPDTSTVESAARAPASAQATGTLRAWRRHPEIPERHGA